jgi:glycosyltransferase involved in cell wall biosynthesis
MVTLDVLIPTRNRARQLTRAIESLLAATVPEGLAVTIVPIDNGSSDGTGPLLEWLGARFPDRIRVVEERRCGKSRALNAGINATSGDLVGMIDDDEEVDAGWYAEILRAFTGDPELDFIGGPYKAVWAADPPGWIPRDYLAVLGEVDSGHAEGPFGPDFDGILKGGNAVIRRRTLLAAGPYAEWLGPAGAARLLSCEDEEMYLRLLKSGARGRYLPSLVVHHHVSAERLTPGYFRRWCFWRGVSRGLMDRAHPMAVAYLGGVPRFLYGSAARGLRQAASRLAARREPSLSDELKAWDLAGFLWGRHIYTLARYSPVRSRRRLRTPFPQMPETGGVSGFDLDWNSSCYPSGDHATQGTRDRHSTGGVGVARHRRASAPPR